MQKKAFPSVNKDGPMQAGMDLREYFAAHALQGLIAKNGYQPENKEALSKVCFEIADALMLARSETKMDF
jgi:hypothetical protein